MVDNTERAVNMVISSRGSTEMGPHIYHQGYIMELHVRKQTIDPRAHSEDAGLQLCISCNCVCVDFCKCSGDLHRLSM